MTKRQKHILLVVILLIIFGKWIYLISWSILKTMTLSVIVLWIVFPPAILIISILYIAFMVFTYKVGEKKVTAYLLGFMIIFSAFFLYDTGWIPGTHEHHTRKLTTMLTGIAYPLPEPVFKHQQHRNFPKYTCSMEAYDLTDDFVNFFTKDSFDLNNFPDRPQELQEWKNVTWQKGSDKEQPPSFLKTVLINSDVKTSESDKIHYIEWIEQAISQPTTYYAYFQNSKDTRDIKFYMVDPAEKKLAVISVTSKKHR